ncbi:MAG TPA: hypothetical protein VIC28_16690 [Thermoanaerobaculia bacterium]|jgi:hypothetical protein
MRLKRTLILACLTGAFVLTTSLFAEEPAAPAAEAQASVSMDEAGIIALAKVPGGELTSKELGRLSGKLTYFFDIRTAGKKGVDVVSINASDGTVVSVKHKSEWAMRRDAQTKRRNAARQH